MEQSLSSTEQKSSKKSNFPPELEKQMRDFHNSLDKVQKVIDPLFEIEKDVLQEKLEPIDKARYNISSAYMLNSLYWVYLKTKGINAQEHEIKHEMERIKTYMLRLKEINDKTKAPKLDSKAAERFVRSSLWEPKEQKNDNGSDEPLTKKKRNC